jgi:hypothetical protein
MKEESCLPISTTLAELERSVSQDAIQAKSTQSPISISAHMPRESIDLTSQRSASIAISESITHAEESISIRVDFLAPTQVGRETEKGLTETSLSSGLNICDVSTKADPDLLSLKTQQDYSIAEWEESCKAYPRSGTMQNGRLSALPCLEVPKKGKEFSSLPIPTLTTGLGSGRNAGATKLEKWLKDKSILLSTQALNPQMMALLFNFPKDWTACLWESPRELEAEMTLEPYLGEPSTSTVQPLFSSESSTSIAFSVKIIDATPSSPLEQLEFLRSERDRMINLGASPQGVWIERSKPAKRDFVQVVWKSSSPRTEWCDRKSRYIGKENSDEHLSAIAQYAAGKKLQAIEKEIRKLES